MQYIPEELQEALICEALNLSYTELQQQPESWIENRLIILESRAKSDELKAKKKSK